MTSVSGMDACDTDVFRYAGICFHSSLTTIYYCTISSHLSYQRELDGWEELLVNRKAEVEDSRRKLESKRNVGFNQLHSVDEQTLHSYLTPQQRHILDKPVLSNPGFMEEATEKLDSIVSGVESVKNVVF